MKGKLSGCPGVYMYVFVYVKTASFRGSVRQESNFLENSRRARLLFLDREIAGSTMFHVLREFSNR